MEHRQRTASGDVVSGSGSGSIRLGLVLVLVVAGLSIAILRHASNARRALYQGRTVEQWLGELSTTNGAEARRAFRTMGTNEFQVLLQILKKKDSRWDKVNRWIYPRLPAAMKSRWRPPLSSSEQQDIWMKVEMVLTNNDGTKKLLPELARILENKNLASHDYVLTVVAVMAGPENKECVPALIRGLEEKDFGLRYFSFIGLEQIGPQARAAVPALTHLIETGDADLRKRALHALKIIVPESAAKYGSK